MSLVPPNQQQIPLQQQQKHGYFLIKFAPNQQMPDVIWSKDTAIVGRSNTKSSEKDNFLPIGKYKTISREHGAIAFDKQNGCWTLKVLGKRGISSNGRKIEKDQIIALPMDVPTPIKMGESKFYFCPAAPPFSNVQYNNYEQMHHNQQAMYQMSQGHLNQSHGYHR